VAALPTRNIAQPHHDDDQPDGAAGPEDSTTGRRRAGRTELPGSGMPNRPRRQGKAHGETAKDMPPIIPGPVGRRPPLLAAPAAAGAPISGAGRGLGEGTVHGLRRARAVVVLGGAEKVRRFPEKPELLPQRTAAQPPEIRGSPQRGAPRNRVTMGQCRNKFRRGALPEISCLFPSHQDWASAPKHWAQMAYKVKATIRETGGCGLSTAGDCDDLGKGV